LVIPQEFDELVQELPWSTTQEATVTFVEHRYELSPKPNKPVFQTSRSMDVSEVMVTVREPLGPWNAYSVLPTQRVESSALVEDHEMVTGPPWGSVKLFGEALTLQLREGVGSGSGSGVQPPSVPEHPDAGTSIPPEEPFGDKVAIPISLEIKTLSWLLA
jgi:hypothetical protein